MWTATEMREIALKVAWHFLGTPYRWGGDDSMSGWDCSGFIIECLKSVKILPRQGDWTAQGLWERFEGKQVDQPGPGCLIFWQNTSGRAIHVELCLNEDLSIGASGGGSKILTRKNAIKANAYVKIRPFRARPNIKGYVDPFG